MPYPTAEIGDNVVYWDGTAAHPALVTTIAGGGVVGLQVVGAMPGYPVKVVPFDSTQATADSWSWPVGGSVQPTPAFNSQSGSSYISTVNDRVVGMSDDAARTFQATITPAGTFLRVIDTSGSVTAGHTITFSGGATIHGVATITPGTNTSVLLASDGTAFWVVQKQ